MTEDQVLAVLADRAEAWRAKTTPGEVAVWVNALSTEASDFAPEAIRELVRNGVQPFPPTVAEFRAARSSLARSAAMAQRRGELPPLKMSVEAFQAGIAACRKALTEGDADGLARQ